LSAVSARALDAAGITDPGLRAAYEECRRLHAAHGKTYYLATLLLPPAKRPYVWALYGFARYADEFVDSLEAPDPQALLDWGAAFLDALSAASPSAAQSHPVSRAMTHTMRRWLIPRSHVEAFLESMRMDITITGYETYADLEKYMYGSASVIGLQMLPILEPVAPGAAARARALGEAFQMSNFLRDVGEDLDRGRVYLPEEDLDRFGVNVGQLRQRVVDDRFRALLRFEIDRARGLLATAAVGIRLLHPTSRDCVRTALALYGGILDEIERADYRVLDRRVSVGVARRAALAANGVGRAWLARRPHHTHQASVCSTSEKPNARSSIGA